jgi:hypothetical protein
MVKNITLSVDAQVLTAVRRYAAEHDATINSLVRDYLKAIAEREDRAANARTQIRALSKKSPARIGNPKHSRDELHER